MKTQFRFCTNCNDPLLIQERNVMFCDGGQPAERKRFIVLCVILIVAGCGVCSFMRVCRNVAPLELYKTSANPEIVLDIDSRRLNGTKYRFRTGKIRVRSRTNVHQEFSEMAS